MKIGIVTQWYPPEPAFIPASLATELVARGHQVRVLTGFPNYPSGKLYPGYRQRWQHVETLDGVTVRRVPLYLSHDSSGMRRAANYLSYGLSSSLAGMRFLAGSDVVYVYLTPATAFMAAAVLKKLDRVPVVIHVQDVWPESVTESSMAPSGTNSLYVKISGIGLAQGSQDGKHGYADIRVMVEFPTQGSEPADRAYLVAQLASILVKWHFEALGATP